MKAIYKRECKAFFSSPIGYVFVAFLMCVVGLYFTIYNLKNQYPWFGVGLSNTAFILMLIVPIATMKIMADDQRQRTDQLLFTAPVRITEIVLGKYFSLLTVLAIPVIIFCAYPLILLGFGKQTTSLAMDYVAIFGYFMLGASSLSIGLYISTLTESQVLAAVLTFAVLLVSFFSNALSTLIPTDAGTSLICLTILICLISIIIYFMTRNIILTISVGIVLEAAILLIYIIKSTLFESLFNKMLSVLDMTQRMTNMVYGNLNLSVIVYYLSVIFLFLFLSVQAIYKRRWS